MSQLLVDRLPKAGLTGAGVWRTLYRDGITRPGGAPASVRIICFHRLWRAGQACRGDDAVNIDIGLIRMAAQLVLKKDNAIDLAFNNHRDLEVAAAIAALNGPNREM